MEVLGRPRSPRGCRISLHDRRRGVPVVVRATRVGSDEAFIAAIVFLATPLAVAILANGDFRRRAGALITMARRFLPRVRGGARNGPRSRGSPSASA